MNRDSQLVSTNVPGGHEPVLILAGIFDLVLSLYLETKMLNSLSHFSHLSLS